MGTDEPRAYPKTDQAEQDALRAFENAIDSKFVKHHIRTRDKVPNIDGAIELVNEDQRPIAKLEVQLKTLPSGASSFPCPASLVGYSDITSVPVILVCASLADGRVYWRHICRTMPEFVSDQKSFTIHFDEFDEVGKSSTYLQKWLSSAAEYQTRVKDFPRLKSQLRELTTLDRISPSDVAAFQECLDKINSLLDGPFRAIKKLYFPGVWKFGFAVFFATEEQIRIQLFTVRYGEGAPLLCGIRSHGEFAEFNPGARLGSSFTAKRSYFNSADIGSEFVLEKVRTIVGSRLFKVTGIAGPQEVVLAFFERQRLLRSFLDDSGQMTVTTATTAIDRLLRTCSAITREVVGQSTDAILTLDISKISESDFNRYGDHYDVSCLQQCDIDARPFSLYKVIEAVRELRAMGVSTLSRPVRRNRSQQGKWIWSGYSRCEEEQQVRHVLFNAVSEYKSFVEVNELELPRSPYLSSDLSIVFQYYPIGVEDDLTSRPWITELHVENHDRKLPKVVVDFDNGTNPDSSHQKLDKKYYSEIHKIVHWSNGDASFLFSAVPTVDCLYRMVENDLQTHYRIGPIISEYFG